MITELAVRDLGVLAELSLALGPGMTALTGETGAGKTLLVTAIELLVGGRAEPGVVRPGATEARVDGRFVDASGDEVVLSRVVPADGRSRAYVDGRPASVAEITERGRSLVDLHGQHAHQSLLAPAVQRASLDDHGGVDLAPYLLARRQLGALEAELTALGGDERARARELDLLRFQVAELDAAGITGDDEDERLAAEEALLADAVNAREAAATGYDALAGDGGALDGLGSAIASVAGRPAFEALDVRLRSVAAELTDAAADLRSAGESLEEDPERLEELRTRRATLRELRRKYGESVAEIRSFHAQTSARLTELERHEARAAVLESELTRAREQLGIAAAAVRSSRLAGAPVLAADVAQRLQALAMAGASMTVDVGDAGAGDEVQFLIAANRGEGAQPLAKVASGGELARVMLALRLALVDRGAGRDGRTLVFDEVDAGIGGEAALAVGRALADLGREAQVLVVTHLPQVAAFADRQVAVTKSEQGGRTVASAIALDDAGRVVELSRMLSGQPGSAVARVHAEELLAVARRGGS